MTTNTQVRHHYREWPTGQLLFRDCPKPTASPDGALDMPCAESAGRSPSAISTIWHTFARRHRSSTALPRALRSLRRTSTKNWLRNIELSATCYARRSSKLDFHRHGRKALITFWPMLRRCPEPTARKRLCICYRKPVWPVFRERHFSAKADGICCDSASPRPMSISKKLVAA